MIPEPHRTLTANIAYVSALWAVFKAIYAAAYIEGYICIPPSADYWQAIFAVAAAAALHDGRFPVFPVLPRRK